MPGDKIFQGGAGRRPSHKPENPSSSASVKTMLEAEAEEVGAVEAVVENMLTRLEEVEAEQQVTPADLKLAVKKENIPGRSHASKRKTTPAGSDSDDEMAEAEADVADGGGVIAEAKAAIAKAAADSDVEIYKYYRKGQVEDPRLVDTYKDRGSTKDTSAVTPAPPPPEGLKPKRPQSHPAATPVTQPNVGTPSAVQRPSSPSDDAPAPQSQGGTGAKKELKFQGLQSEFDREDFEISRDSDSETTEQRHRRNKDINQSRVKDSLGFPEDGESGANWLSWLIKTSDHWLYAMAAINAVYEANKEALGLLGTLAASAVINLCLKTIFRDGRGGWRLTLGVVLVLVLMIGAGWSTRGSLSTTSRIVAGVVFVVICAVLGMTLHARDKHHVVEQITNDKVGWLDGRRPRAGGRAGMAFENGVSQGPYIDPKSGSAMLVTNSVQQPVTGSYHMGCEGGQPQIGRVGLYGVTDKGGPSVAMILGKISDSYGMPSSHMQLWSAFIAYAVYRVSRGDVGRELKKQGEKTTIFATATAWTVSVVILTIVGLDRVRATRCNSGAQVFIGLLVGASTGMIGYTMIDEEARF